MTYDASDLTRLYLDMLWSNTSWYEFIWYDTCGHENARVVFPEDKQFSDTLKDKRYHNLPMKNVAPFLISLKFEMTLNFSQIMVHELQGIFKVWEGMALHCLLCQVLPVSSNLPLDATWITIVICKASTLWRRSEAEILYTNRRCRRVVG